ncbi:MAG: PAS domain S-box protein [Deltaproteobacteria bacterium]|nr:PAS domain S-box protein [Deltaproteobacteria bacterium]
MNARGPTDQVGRRIVEAMATPVFACDANGRVIEFSPAFGELFEDAKMPEPGVAIDELFGSRIAEFVRDRIRESIADPDGAPRTVRVPEYAATSDAESPLAPLTELTFIAAHDACVVLVQSSALPLLVDGPFRRRIPLFALAENTRDIVFMTDADGVVNYAGAPLREVTGASPERIAGQDMASFFHRDDRDAIRTLFEEVREGQTGFRDGVRIFHEDGHILRLTISLSPLWSRTSEFAGTIGIARDTTREHKLERRLERTRNLEMMRNLAEGIAGDFNNILTGIMGNLSLLRAMVPRGDLLWGPLGRIEQSAERAVRLTQQLIACSRGGRGTPQALNVNDAIRRCVEQHEIRRDAEIVIRMNLAEPATVIYADPAYIRQAIDNLLQNAWEATPGGGTVTIRTDRILISPGMESELGPGEYARIVVKDTGVGIEEEHLGRIFEPFFTTKSMRRGLGLTAVHGIVSTLDGSVDAANTPEGGAILTVCIPMVGGRSYPHEEDRPRPLDLSVLVIDDERVVREFCEVALAGSGARVTVAETGEEGIQTFAEDPDAFDAVLLDLVLGDMPGELVFARLRRIRPDVRVILSSGFPQAIDDAREPGRFDGAAGLLVKPFDINRLVEILLGITGANAD